jgi:zinc transporter ZupT
MIKNGKRSCKRVYLLLLFFINKEIRMTSINIIIILGIATIMSLTDYFGHKISGLAGKNRDIWLSLSGGILTALLFLILIPDLISTNNGEISFSFLFILIGFLFMHLAEKYIYQHETNKQKFSDNLKLIHIFGFGLDNFLVGFILASVLETDLSVALNLSIPLFLQMLTSSFSLDSIDTPKSSLLSKIILSLLPIIGALIGILLELDQAISSYLLAFALGVLFYMIVRDVIPQGNRGRASLYFLGNLISIILWILRFLI